MYMKVMCNFPVLLAELKYDIACIEARQCPTVCGA